MRAVGGTIADQIDAKSRYRHSANNTGRILDHHQTEGQGQGQEQMMPGGQSESITGINKSVATVNSINGEDWGHDKKVIKQAKYVDQCNLFMMVYLQDGQILPFAKVTHEPTIKLLKINKEK